MATIYANLFPGAEPLPSRRLEGIFVRAYNRDIFINRLIEKAAD